MKGNPDMSFNFDCEPYARDPYARDPYTRDQYTRDPYAQIRDPYAHRSVPFSPLPPLTRGHYKPY